MPPASEQLAGVKTRGPGYSFSFKHPVSFGDDDEKFRHCAGRSDISFEGALAVHPTSRILVLLVRRPVKM